MIKNYKFNKLLTSFSKVHNNSDSKLKEIFSDSRIFKLYKGKKNFRKKTRLEELYGYLFNNFKKNLKLGTKIINKNDFGKKKNLQKTVYSNIPRKIKTSYLENDKIVQKTPIKLINLINDSLNSIIIDYKKNQDFYSKAFFSAVDETFYIMNDLDKKNYLKNMKIKCIDIFNKNNYYKEYDFTSSMFRKSDLDECFTTNSPITLPMLKVYSNIFNVNCVYVTVNNIKFITKFNKLNATIIIGETETKIYCIHKPFIRGEDCMKLLGINKQYSKESLEKLKLPDLQNIARMYNFNIRKQGKSNRININKKEFIEILSIG